ncbi:MAG: hypothetical protein HYS27_10665 [Deltaproteobacteria bacterium]|nr:hypothetical protein [Deltaproteobacteria bacterium]
MRRFTLLAVAIVSACPAPPPEPPGDEGEGEGEGEPVPDSTEELPFATWPCDRLDAFPHALTSTVTPLLLHFRRADERAEAERLLGYLEEGWRLEIDELGLAEPLPDTTDDGGYGCGEDERLDVFLWAGHEESFVDVVAERAATATEDYATMMVVDPYGPYGGDVLRCTALHELHHMSQAALDWWDAAVVYEMSATFVEDTVAGCHDSWEFALEEIQESPELPIDLDDGYAGWFMYGQALYLVFLQQGVFDGDSAFLAQMWQGMPSPAGEDPDYQDALDALLAPHGMSFLDTVPRYARWRWYTGARDDGAHFARGALYPEVEVGSVDATGPTSIVVRPALLGTSYLAVSGEGSVTLDVEGVPAGARVVVQALPGDAADGDVLTLPAAVTLPRTLAVTALPDGPTDVDARSTAPLALTVRLTR